MKKSQLVFTFIFIFSLALSAQNQRALLAHYQEDTEVFSLNESKSQSSFNVVCTKTEIEMMSDEAKKYGNYLSFTNTESKEKPGSFDVILSFNHSAQPMEYVKILMSMGFTGVKIGEKEYPIDHLLSL